MANSFSALNENLRAARRHQDPAAGTDRVRRPRLRREVRRSHRARQERRRRVRRSGRDVGIDHARDRAPWMRREGLVTVGDGGAIPGAHPMVQVYYAAVSPSAFLETAEPERVDALRDFLAYAISDEGQASAVAAGYTPLTPAIRAVAAAQVEKIRVPAPPAAPPTTDADDRSRASWEGAAGGFGSVSSSAGFVVELCRTPREASVPDRAAPTTTITRRSSSETPGDGDTAGDADDGSVTVEDPSALEVLGEVLDAPMRAVADILTNPGRSPGLFTLMVAGAGSCVVGPIMYRRRPKRAAS